MELFALIITTLSIFSVSVFFIVHSEGILKLAGKDPAGFMNKVALKAQAQKPQKPKAAQPHRNEATLEIPQSPDKEDRIRNPFQRLIDKFK